MTDFSKIIDKARELEAKMKESQEKIKNIRVEGVAGNNSVKVTLDGEGEMQKIEISNDILKEDIHILMTFSSILISFIVSFFTIKWFLSFVKKVGFLPFIIYRLFLGVSILWLI